MTDASTTSRPLFNRQQLISLFLPLVAEQALSISIGLADTLMVSSVGEAAVSGVSLVDNHIHVSCTKHLLQFFLSGRIDTFPDD